MYACGDLHSESEVVQLLEDLGYETGTKIFEEKRRTHFQPADGVPGSYIEISACPPASSISEDSGSGQQVGGWANQDMAT